MWRPPPPPQIPLSNRTLLGCSAAGVATLCLMPWVLPPYYLFLVSYALVLAIASLGVNLLLGYTGLLSLGHAAYFGAGAYTGGFLYTFFTLTSVEAYLLAGVVAATALAVLTGFLCVQATKIYFTILTLAIAQMIHSLFISGAVFELAGIEGRGLFILGGGGLVIPRFAILGNELPPETFYTALYFLIAAAFVLSLGATWVIINSPFGKALQAIRDDDVRAACIGIRLRSYRWAAFVLSATIVGLAGGLFGQLDRQITPAQLHWLFSAKLVLAAVLGGHRFLLGPATGALVLTGLQEFALRYTGYHGLILGFLLITVVLALPGGLVGSAIAAAFRLQGLVAATRRP